MHLLQVPGDFFFSFCLLGHCLERKEINGPWSVLTRLSGRPERQKKLSFRVQRQEKAPKIRAKLQEYSPHTNLVAGSQWPLLHNRQPDFALELKCCRRRAWARAGGWVFMVRSRSSLPADEVTTELSRHSRHTFLHTWGQYCRTSDNIVITVFRHDNSFQILF